MVGEQRRVDPAGQGAQVIEGRAEPGPQLAGKLPDFGGIFGGVVEQGELDGERDQLLLGAVVQVALDLLPLGVLGLHQPPPRRPQIIDAGLQLGGQGDVAQHQPGLGGQVGQQLVFGGRHRLARRLLHGDRAEQLIPVADRDRPGYAEHRKIAGASEPCSGGRGGSGRPGHLRAQLDADPDPDLHPDRAGGAGQHRRHPLQCRAGVQLPGHVLREVGEHLVGRGPPPVHDPVRQKLRPAAKRLEQHRDRQRRRHIEQRPARVTSKRPDPHHDQHVDRRQRRRQQPVPDGTVDDDVDLVQAVLQDRHRDSRGNPEQRDDRYHNVGGGRHRV